MPPADRFVAVARALALGGALVARLNGCNGVVCECAADAATAHGARLLPDGGRYLYSITSGACTPAETASGCQSLMVPGGPLAPPELPA